MEAYLADASIPLLLTIVLGYYSFRLLVLHDVEAIRGKNGKKLKDKEAYTREAGKLLAFLTLSSLLMAVLMYWSSRIAFLQLTVCLVIFGLMWKKMNDKYGE